MNDTRFVFPPRIHSRFYLRAKKSRLKQHANFYYYVISIKKFHIPLVKLHSKMHKDSDYFLITLSESVDVISNIKILYLSREE